MSSIGTTEGRKSRFKSEAGTETKGSLFYITINNKCSAIDSVKLFWVDFR